MLKIGFRVILILFKTWIYPDFANSVDPDQLASEESALFAINPCPAEPGYTLPLQTV